MELSAPHKAQEQVRMRPAHDPVTIFAMKSKEISSLGEDLGLNSLKFPGGCSGNHGSVQNGEQVSGALAEKTDAVPSVHQRNRTMIPPLCSGAPRAVETAG
jgi:hypothetical protein